MDDGAALECYSVDGGGAVGFGSGAPVPNNHPAFSGIVCYDLCA